MVLITDEVESTFKEGRFISCSHCGCRNIVKEHTTSDLREVMKARRYKRNKRGALEHSASIKLWTHFLNKL